MCCICLYVWFEKDTKFKFSHTINTLCGIDMCKFWPPFSSYKDFFQYGGHLYAHLCQFHFGFMLLRTTNEDQNFLSFYVLI
jgi:hypothetical protein